VLIAPELISEDGENLVINSKYIPLALAYNSYDDRKPFYADTLRAFEYSIFPVTQGLLLTFTLPDIPIYGKVLLLRLKDIINKVDYVLDINVPAAINPLPAEYLLTYANGVPLMPAYGHCDDTLLIRGFEMDRRTLFVTYYSMEFKPAIPPMAVTTRQDEQNLVIDTTFTIQTGVPFRLHNAGLYLFQTDTNAATGIPIRINCHRYPRPSRAKELIDALIYITTTDERSRIQRGVNPKRELDNFWIAQGGSKDNARMMIQNYYRRVEFANKYFTTFKEGWRTDKGLVYIIFGTPSKVRRYADSEIWEYPKKSLAGEQQFTFYYRPNLFSSKHHELQRSIEYDIYWYTAVEQIRKGLNEQK
jgi:GWxTD domain-containing protein